MLLEIREIVADFQVVIGKFQCRRDVAEWEKLGVPFRSHIYVPETHSLTSMPFHEREDETHVLKVCVAEPCFLVDAYNFIVHIVFYSE